MPLHTRRLAFILCVVSILIADAATAATFTVTNASDSGPGSLRDAIDQANVSLGPDTIVFAIASGPQSITLLSALPDITDPVTIDGTSQPGYSGVPLIELSGAATPGGSAGILIRAPTGGSTIRGLMISRFPGNGITLGGDGNTIENCYIGTDSTRTQNRGNGGSGIYVFEGDGNLIRSNVIAFNVRDGVTVQDGSTGGGYPNFTGTPDFTGTFSTIDFTDDCGAFHMVGGPVIVDTAGRSFLENFGMRLTGTVNVSTSGTYFFNLLQLDDQARIVVDAAVVFNGNGPGPQSGAIALTAGSHSLEIDFFEGGGAASLQLAIGGPGTATLSAPGGPGLQGELFQTRVAAERNRISMNSIFDNGTQGIALGCCCVEPNDANDIDPGPNTFLNRPEITSVDPVGGDRFFPNGVAPPNATVEFFASTNDAGWQGHGEGKVFLASTIADGSGNFSGDVILPQPYYTITATATDALGNTSEFSASVPARPNPVVVNTLSDSGAPGTLRDAIGIANSDGFETLITFEPGLSGGTISLTSPLPVLTENGTTINGDINGDCKPDIELEASSYVGDVIVIQSSSNTIRGLAINRFSNFSGIHITGPGNTVACNYIGTDRTGSFGYAAIGQGILIESSGNSNSIRDNLISACLNGVHIAGASSNQVFTNVFGLAANGTTTLQNDVGILISGNGFLNTIAPGGTGNRIVSRLVGISLLSANNNDVHSNDIRWPSGSSVPTNTGILIQGADNRVGTAGANRIENNGSSGIRVVGPGSVRNTLRGNTINENGGLGIDLDGDGVTPNDSGDGDTGPNERMNFPTLTSAATNGSTTTVQGFLDTLSPQSALVDLFVSAVPDITGYGEGSTLLGSMTPSSSGSFSFAVLPTPIGSWITATATDAAGNTSEFSAATQVIGPAISATNLLAIPRSSSSIELRWTDPQQTETGFRIERQAGMGWQTIGTVGPNTTSFTDSGLGPSQTQHYRVVAFSPAGDAPPSNLASATTHAGAALKVCRQTIGATHQAAFATSVAFNGTNYGVAWADKRDGLEEEIYFQLRSAVDGGSVAPAIRITNDDMPSRLPTLRWNGTQFGLLWFEHVRPPGGQVTVRLAFATLSATGAIMRGPVRTVTNLVSGNLATDGEIPLIWDGAGWGVFLADAFPPNSLIAYLRFDVDGDLVSGPLQVTPTGPGTHVEVSAAWNGLEYGLAWVEQTGLQWQIRFKRMLPDGTLVGSGAMMIRNQGPNQATGVSMVAEGSDWALAWSDVTSTASVVSLLRLNRDGTTKGPAARMSDDGDVFDELPRLFLKSGGGYVAFVTMFEGTTEVMRLEADAAGQRVGTRMPVSGDPLKESILPHAATDGTSFLVAWEEGVEIAATVVSSAGVTGPLQNITTNHTAPWNAVLPGVARLQDGFVTTWGESDVSGFQMRARLHRLDGTVIDKTPLVPGVFVRKSTAIATGGDFALAWTDGAAVRFDRFDQNGNSFMAGGIEISSVANANRAPAIAYNGELWGIIWVQSSQVRFRRASTTVALSPTVTIPSTNPNDLQLQWIGSSWVLVWRQTSDLWFARLDAAGALLAGPSQITFTGGVKSEVQLAWSGENLGLAWSEDRFGAPNFSEIVFTVLEIDGTKRFPEVTAVTSRYVDRLFALIAETDRFRIIYQEPFGGVREVEVLPTGALGASRFLGNHGEGRIAAATNGLITGMAWVHGRDLYFQTTACLTDTTPPTCPNLNAPFLGIGVSLSWNSVNDPDSSILSYNVYRDVALIAEVRGSTLNFPDHGFTPGGTHVYEVRAVNGAYLESSGCTTRTVVAGINVQPATLPDGRVNTNYNQTFTAVGGASPYTFAVTAGALPTGLTLNGTTGQLTGQPSPAGSHTFTITATDSAAQTGSRAYVLRVCSLNPLTTVLANGQVGNAYSQAVVATAGFGGVTYAVTSGSLPAGLTLNTSGVLAGTPTTVGSSTFTVTATDSIGCTMLRSYTVQISSGTAPRNLGATTQSSSAVMLRWTDPQRSETGFRIERSVDGTTWAPIDIVGANATSYTSSGLSGATLYYFRIVAIAASGDAGTSNVASAMTFPASAAKVCATSVGSFFSWARSPYVAHNGTQWAMAWEERNPTLGNTEVFFQLLDQTTGQRVGSPVRVSNNDMISGRPLLTWNGTHFGLLWMESPRGPTGEPAQAYRFALLDASGNLVRRDVRVATQPSGIVSVPLELVWDGSGWAFLESRFVGQAVDLYFHRLDADGDVTNANVQITTHPDLDLSGRLAWNGTHFGVLWLRFRDQYAKLYFQRLDPTGGVVGTAVELVSEPVNGLGSPDLIVDGTGWTVSYSRGTDTEFASYLIRLDATGAPIAPASRLSDDTDTTAPGLGIIDDFNDLYLKPGGGYVAYVRSQIGVNRTFEVARLEADISGNRVGSRIVLSTVDSFISGIHRSAFDGSNFLIAWNEGRTGTQEIANAIVSPTGTITAGPTDLTTGHSVGNSLNALSAGNPTVAPVGSGFAALWTEPVAVLSQIHAQIFDGNGATIGTRAPLTATTTRGRPGVVGVGNTFAVVWKNSTNAVLFGRYDSTGAPLIAEAQIATGAGGPPNVTVAWNGEEYGVAYLRGPNLTLQKVSTAGAAVGPAVTVTEQAAGGITPQIQWTGSGWALLWLVGADLQYALLDTDGAFIVRPIQVTFSPTVAKSQFLLLWTGEKFGVVWAARPLIDPPGQHIAFTLLNTAGVKEIGETIVAQDILDQNNPSLNWDLDHFRLTWFEGLTLREIDILPSGATSGPSRMLSNRGGPNATAWNGATLGVLWNQQGHLYFQTSACLADSTPPSCPAAAGSQVSDAIRITWSAATDAESGILRYHVYRDGTLLAEVLPTNTSFDDRGFIAGTTHSYVVRALNGAYRESAGCASVDVTTVLPVPASLVATATGATQVALTWNAISGVTYEVLRSSNGGAYVVVGSPSTFSHTDNTVSADTTYLYVVRSVGAGGARSVNSALDLATTVIFANDPLTAGTTITAQHVTQLRTAVNAVRAAAGMTPFSFTDPTLAAGAPIRAAHLTQIRSALDAARTTLGVTPLTYTDPSIVVGVTVAKAAHFQEPRNGVK